MSNDFPEMVPDKVFCIRGKEKPYRMIRQSVAVRMPDSFRGSYNGRIRWYVPWYTAESWPADDLVSDLEDPEPATDRFNSVE